MMSFDAFEWLVYKIGYSETYVLIEKVKFELTVQATFTQPHMHCKSKRERATAVVVLQDCVHLPDPAAPKMPPKSATA